MNYSYLKPQVKFFPTHCIWSLVSKGNASGWNLNPHPNMSGNNVYDNLGYFWYLVLYCSKWEYHEKTVIVVL